MDALGVDPKLLLTQIINFLIMIAVLTKLLYKPILTALEERRQKIAESLKAAERAQKEEEKLSRKREELLAEAREEVRVILSNAKKDGQKVKEELVEEGKEEVAQMKARMEKEMTTSFEALEEKAASRTVDIAAAMVKRLLPELLTEEKQHELIVKQLKQMEKQHGQK